MNFTFLNKTLKRQAGFTLTEVMIGGGILAGVGLAGAMIFKEQKMAQKKIDNEQTLNVFHQNLIRSMNNPFNCNATFKPLIDANATSISGSMTALYSCGGTDPTTGGLATCSDFKKGVAAIGQGPALLTKGAFIDPVNSTELWKVNDIVIPNPVTTTGPLIINVIYELNPAKFPGKPTVTKQILLNARFSKVTSSNPTSHFMECSNSQDASVNNLQNDICKSLSAISSTGSVVATWDEATQSCKTNGSSLAKLKSCPSGMIVEGIRSDGSVHCKYPTTGLSCPPSIPAKVPVLKTDVDGKMKVICE